MRALRGRAALRKASQESEKASRPRASTTVLVSGLDHFKSYRNRRLRRRHIPIVAFPETGFPPIRSYRKSLRAQPVDATPSNQLIRTIFPPREPICPVVLN